MSICSTTIYCRGPRYGLQAIICPNQINFAFCETVWLRRKHSNILFVYFIDVCMLYHFCFGCCCFVIHCYCFDLCHYCFVISCYYFVFGYYCFVFRCYRFLSLVVIVLICSSDVPILSFPVGVQNLLPASPIWCTQAIPHSIFLFWLLLFCRWLLLFCHSLLLFWSWLVSKYNNEI